MISILMSWLGLSFLFPALDQPSPFKHLRSTIAEITMHSPHSCNTDSIQASLRTWIDTTPRFPDGALPPGSISPGIPQAPSHSHALNIELQLYNTSEQTQQVQIEQASWQQGAISSFFSWSRQPVMSPLNRFNTVQRLPLDLNPSQAVNVKLTLTVNGKPCSLTASSTPNLPGKPS